MKKFLAMFAALVAALAFTVLAPSPAEAVIYGWSGRQCYRPVVTGQLCVQVHTVPSGNGLRVDTVEVCVTKLPQYPYPGPDGSKSNAIFFYGSSGNYIGGFDLNNTGASTAGVCILTGPFAGVQMGNGACYVAGGTVDMPLGPDASWSRNGKVLGGSWNC